MISFDTENKPDGTLTLCIFFNGTTFDIFDYKDFKNQLHMKQEILSFISDCKYSTFLAHNLEYDLLNISKPVFIDYFEWYYSGRLLFACLYENPKKQFIDTFNFSFSPLKILGKNIGLEKIDTDDYYNIEYCKRDAEIVYRYYEKFSDRIRTRYNLPLKKTLAGSSQNVLLKKYVNDKIDEININPEILKGYFGGRCEVFNTSKIEKYIVELDVNSMYPYVMKNNIFPVENYVYSKKPICDNYISRINVTIDKNIDIPIIPLRQEKLYFPVGNFETFATSIEIKKAIEENQIIDIEYFETYNFKTCENVFYNFVTDIYEHRKRAKIEKRDFDALVDKYLLNSVYGRFALNKELKILTKVTDENYDRIEKITDFYGWLTVENTSTKNKNYAIASFVTAYSRVVLFDLIKQIKNEGYIPLYTDTDSCYFTTKNKIKLNTLLKNVLRGFPVNNEIGGLSCAIYTGGQFHNAKMYQLYNFNNDEKFKIKGIPEKNRKEYIEKKSVTFKKPVKLRSGLRGVQGKDFNVWYDYTITQIGTYNKREVLQNGNTRPIIKDEKKIL